MIAFLAEHLQRLAAAVEEVVRVVDGLEARIAKLEDGRLR